jgi:putative endonuclease
MAGWATLSRFQAGWWAEYIAAFYLFCKGYSLLAHRQRTPVGEIDLLVSKGQTLVVVEVKYRKTMAQSAQAISPLQQDRLRRAARYVLAERGESSQYDVRFDAVLISPWRLPQHVSNAWQD